MFTARLVEPSAAVSRSIHLPAPANLGQRLAPLGGFRVLDIEPPELTLETKGFTLGLDRCLQRRTFRRQLPPQLEGDLGQAGVGLGYRFEPAPGVRLRSCAPHAVVGNHVANERRGDTGSDVRQVCFWPGNGTRIGQSGNLLYRATERPPQGERPRCIPLLS